jgi:hypothetical protein
VPAAIFCVRDDAPLAGLHHFIVSSNPRSLKMSPTFRSLARPWQWLIPCAIALLCAVPAQAEGPKVIHVEEHWELRLGQPDADRSSPQVTMLLSPNGELDGIHFLFTLNHVTAPTYAPGGMQVQVWDGEQFLDGRVAADAGALAYPDEVVHWVQRLSLDSGTLTFQVVDGESETWGTFGGDDLSLSVLTSLTHLNDYKPGISLTESQVNYAQNRVASLTLTKLVWTTDDGQVHELNAPIAVDTSLDD